MVNHPHRSAASVEVMMAAQGSSLVYLDRKLVAGISTDANGRWILHRLERRDGRNEIVGPETLNVSGIFHSPAELNRAIRLFVADPARVASLWPASGLRAQCKAVLEKLS